MGLEHRSFGFYNGKSFSPLGTKESTLNVRSILEGADGALWVAAELAVIRIQPNGSMENFSLPGLATNVALNIFCGYEDRQGRVWFGTAQQGLYCWERGKITKLVDPELDQTVVHSVAEIGFERNDNCGWARVSGCIVTRRN